MVICMWDPIQKLGAMAHMFQSCREMIDASHSRSERMEGASPDSAVPYLLLRMLGLGALQKNIRVRLVGAGNMFSGVADGSALDVGKGILTCTLLAINQAGLTLNSQSVGGKFGRSVSFSVSSGLIRVGLTNGDHVLL